MPIISKHKKQSSVVVAFFVGILGRKYISLVNSSTLNSNLWPNQKSAEEFARYGRFNLIKFENLKQNSQILFNVQKIIILPQIMYNTDE